MKPPGQTTCSGEFGLYSIEFWFYYSWTYPRKPVRPASLGGGQELYQIINMFSSNFDVISYWIVKLIYAYTAGDTSHWHMRHQCICSAEL